MLAAKKISTKKKIIYYLVIIIMIGGTFFSIYKNYQLASGPNDEISDFTILDMDMPIEDGADIQINQNNKVETVVNIDNGVLDVSVLKDPKFINLQDASVVQVPKVDIGKNNPFEPK